MQNNTDNTDLDRVISLLHKHEYTLQSIYNVKNIGIFGSAARKEDKRTSDIDILIELSKPLGFFKFIKLEDFLSMILKRKVDLVTKQALKPIIKQQILHEVIYA